MTSPPAASARPFGVVRLSAGFAAAALLLVALALANPVSRDEAAYISAAAVPTGARVYADFLYLQTPLQAWLVGPVSRLAPGSGFVALRVVTGLLGALALALVYSSARRAGASDRAAAVSAAGLLACYSFQFGVGVVRNDALALVLALAGLRLMLACEEGKGARALLAGLAGAAFSLAACAKLSYAPPAAALAAFAALEARASRLRPGALAALIAGLAAGAAPLFIAWRTSPRAFLYCAFQFNASTYPAWSRAHGRALESSLAAAPFVFAAGLAVGPGLAALVRLAGSDRLSRWPQLEPAARLLDLLVLAGIASALATRPVNFQYAIPMLAPLAVRLAVLGPLPEGRRRRAFLILYGLGLLAGIGYGASVVGRGLASGGLPPVLARDDARWVGARLRAAGARGVIATLTPQFALGSGYAIDPRFTTGVFFYRASEALPDAEVRALGASGVRTAEADLRDRPPAAVIAGAGADLDAPMERFARSARYDRLRPPDGRFTLYVRPGSAVGRP